MRRILIAILSLLPLAAVAQRENGDIRAGNVAWSNGDYKNAEIAYRNALQINGESYVGRSNLASALYRQNQNADAIEMWQKIAENKKLGRTELSEASYNAATAMLKERQADPSKLDAAIEGFKQALRLNPNDRSAKYNLAYAQALKQDNNGGGGGNNDQNKDKNQDQQNQDQQNQDQQKQDQNKDQQKQDPKDQKDQQQQQETKPQSRADAERMADAIQRAEDRTKEKVDKEKQKAVVGVGGKSW